MMADKRVERDWLHVALDDGDDFACGLAEVDRLDREDALDILTHAIIRLAEGEDVSPDMRQHIALALDTGVVCLAYPPQARRGNRGNPDRDMAIAAVFEVELETGLQRDEALQSTAELIGVDPRSVERALRRHRLNGGDVKSE